jgi:adenosylhomocysteine nucleosidase
MPEVAIVAALERELWPMVRKWRVSERESSGRQFRFFESDSSVAVFGGMGTEAARRATEAIIDLYRPSTVLSVGFAGALDGNMRVGDVFEARYVVDARDGSKTDTGSGAGVLVSFSAVAGKEQKAKLATAYQAQAVDMEAAAVAKGADARGLRFAAIKAISDEAAFPMPPMERFISRDGRFRAASFAFYAALRPGLWRTVFRLMRNSSRASRRLCEYLHENSERIASVSQNVGE